MGQLKFNILYSKNTGVVISPSELIETYFFGTPPRTIEGQALSEEALKIYIRSAQDTIEETLGVKLQRTLISESKDFFRTDWQQWSFVRMSYPVVEPAMLDGYLSDVRQIEYPTEWLSIRKTNDGRQYHRNMYILPGSGSPQTNATVYSGVIPHLGFMGFEQIPNYWRAKYVTGFDKVPSDILAAIGKMAAIPVFTLMGANILGPGIASQSLSIDGLSQSTTTTNSSGSSGFGARVKELQAAIDKELPRLRDYYRGVSIMAA